MRILDLSQWGDLNPEQAAAMAAQAAVERMSVLKYFPGKDDLIKRDEIAALLLRMVRTDAVLNKLVTTMIDIGQWYGPGELRGVLCAIDTPADDKYLFCDETPGYTRDDLEAAYTKRQMLPAQKALPAAKEPPLTDEERKWIDEFNAKLKAKAQARAVAPKNAPKFDSAGYAKWQADVERKQREAADDRAKQEIGR